MILALLWALPSFLLHNLIHEGAHAFVAKREGARDLFLWPFPSWRLGRFTFAHFTYSNPLPPPSRLKISTAPLYAEGCVWVVALVGFVLIPVPWVKWICLVEMISALVDCTVWVIPFYRKNANPGTDAMRARALSSFADRPTACTELSALGLFFPYVATAAALVSLVTR